MSTSQTSSQIPVTGPGARQPGAVCAVQELSEQRFNDLLGLNLADLKRRCSSVGVTTSDKSSKPQLQAALLHFMTRHMDKAPARSVAADADAEHHALQDDFKLKCLQVMQEWFEPRLQNFAQQVTDLAAHNAVQDTLVGQLRSQLAETQLQLHATQAQVQSLSKAAAAAGEAAAEAVDREEIEKRAANLTVSNLTGVSTQADATRVSQALLQHLDVQAQPAVKLLRSTYADAARAGSAATRAGPAGNAAGPSRSSKVLLVFDDVQGKQEMQKSLGKLKGSVFEKIHVDIDLTPAQAAMRRARQPEYQLLQQQGRRPCWRGTELICRQTPKRPGSEPALLVAASAFVPSVPAAATSASPSAAHAALLPSPAASAPVASAVRAVEPVPTHNSFDALA